MNYFDIIFLILLLWSAFQGIRKGFFIMAASLAALILGIWGAIHFSHLMAGWITGHIDRNIQYLSLISFSLTFVLIVIGVHLLARAMDKLIRAVALGFLNRFAGLVFGILKTAFLISIVLVILDAIDRKIPFIPREHKEASLLYRPLSQFAPAIFPYLSFDKIREKTREVDPGGINI